MSNTSTRIRNFAADSQRIAAEIHADSTISSLEAQLTTGYMLGPIALGADGFYSQLRPASRATDKKGFYAHWIIDGQGHVEVRAAVRQDYLDAVTSDHSAMLSTLEFARSVVDQGKTLSRNVQRQLRTIGVIAGLSDSDFPEQWTQPGYKPTAAASLKVIEALEAQAHKLALAAGQKALLERINAAVRARKRTAADPDAPERVRVTVAAD